MTTIGLISDTHNHLDDKFFNFFEPCDMILHAGDIGSLELAEKIARFRPLKAVYGNIDSQETRLVYPETQRFKIEKTEIFMIHIGGYPGKYSAKAKKVLENSAPNIFVCGHSHILRIMYDKKYNCLVMNPGAAGRYGMQTKRTALRFKISDNDINDLEICELDL
ncbi:MAG: metallophosphoesterase family protein [Bacteroidales bacterium]|nr:metallophosphoesterase family protein [Bacteroidales bacterium]